MVLAYGCPLRMTVRVAQGSLPALLFLLGAANRRRRHDRERRRHRPGLHGDHAMSGISALSLGSVIGLIAMSAGAALVLRLESGHSIRSRSFVAKT